MIGTKIILPHIFYNSLTFSVLHMCQYSNCTLVCLLSVERISLLGCVYFAVNLMVLLLCEGHMLLSGMFLKSHEFLLYFFFYLEHFQLFVRLALDFLGLSFVFYNDIELLGRYGRMLASSSFHPLSSFLHNYYVS